MPHVTGDFDWVSLLTSIEASAVEARPGPVSAATSAVLHPTPLRPPDVADVRDAHASAQLHEMEPFYPLHAYVCARPRPGAVAGVRVARCFQHVVNAVRSSVSALTEAAIVGWRFLAAAKALRGRTRATTARSRHLLIVSWDFPPSTVTGGQLPASLARCASHQDG